MTTALVTTRDCTCEAAAGGYSTHLPTCPVNPVRPHARCWREFCCNNATRDITLTDASGSGRPALLWGHCAQHDPDNRPRTTRPVGHQAGATTTSRFD
jgi:hypothetical protein